MGLKKTSRIPRVLVAKIGLDGHSRGAHVIAHGLRQEGMEVIYTGLRQTPASVARSAIQEDADVIGISSMVGAHTSVVRKLAGELAANNASDIPIIIGGIIPEEDYDLLIGLGVRKVFPPGSRVQEIAQFIRAMVDEPMWAPEVPGSLTGRNIQELRLLGSRCGSCGRVYFPSRRNCPHCMTENVQDIPLSDRGVLQTFTVAGVAPPGWEAPHAQGYIDLEDGPRVFSLLSDYESPDKLKTGMAMGLKIVTRGPDKQGREIVGFRFKPVQGLDTGEGK